MEFKPEIESLNIDSKYNTEQKAALTVLINWCKANFDTNKNCYTLAGAAGTGKTTTIKELLKQYAKPTSITATTHKAVRIISQIVGKTGNTIHSLCGLRPNFNIEAFDINNVQFVVKGTPKIRDYNLVIIDEASQLNKGMWELINIHSKQYNTKIIAIGDPYQLPPVNETESIVFSNPNLLTLKTIVRQEVGNPLLELLAISRNDIDNYSFNVLRQLRRVPKAINDKNEGYIVVSLEDYTKGVIPYYKSSQFCANIDFCRTLSHTNKNVLEWNKYIRNNIIKSDKLIELNDFLTAYTTIIDEFLSPIIINSEDYVVKEIVNYVMKDTNVSGFLCKLQALHDGRITPYLFLVDHTNKNSILKLINILKTYRDIALTASKVDRSGAWIKYYEVKNRHLLLSDIIDSQTNKTIISKDIDYGFASTIYKAQGSTYENVFVNAKDILNWTTGIKSDKQTIKLRNKLIYVALSRASKKAIILI